MVESIGFYKGGVCCACGKIQLYGWLDITNGLQFPRQVGGSSLCNFIWFPRKCVFGMLLGRCVEEAKKVIEKQANFSYKHIGGGLLLGIPKCVWVAMG